MSQETITASAVMLNEQLFTLPPPASHKDIVRDQYAQGNAFIGQRRKGYLTSTGRFVTSEEAMPIAKAAGQTGQPGTLDPGDEFQLQASHLWPG